MAKKKKKKSKQKKAVETKPEISKSGLKVGATLTAAGAVVLFLAIFDLAFWAGLFMTGIGLLQLYIVFKPMLEKMQK